MGGTVCDRRWYYRTERADCLVPTYVAVPLMVITRHRFSGLYRSPGVRELKTLFN